MDLMINILFAIEACMGVGSVILIVLVMFATVIKKLYRKVRFGEAIM